MKIFFAGLGSRVRCSLLYKHRCSNLVSFFTLMDPNSGYGELDRLKELIEKLKKEKRRRRR